MTNFTTVPPTAAATRPLQNEGTVMLLHEALARSRMRAAEEAARRHALVRAVTAGRRWRALARFAERRAVAAEHAPVVIRGRLRGA